MLTLFGTGGGTGNSGGMDEAARENVKAAFNDPASPVRVLVATDAASEGLNLHRTARYLLHYDCPWNPSRLEQRNGRLDRYGQARDVTVHHFVSDADPDLRFLGHVIRKADEIREDLGSVNEVFDRAVHRRLIQGEDEDAVTTDLDKGIDSTRGSAVLEVDAGGGCRSRGGGARGGVARCDGHGDRSGRPRALRDTLEAAMAVPHGRPQLRVAEEPGFYRVLRPDLPGWRDVIDESVRRPAPGGAGGGPMPRLAFSPEPFIERLGRLSVFQPRGDALLMHLAHPMMQRAIGVLTRRRYPGGGSEVSRWTVRSGGVPDGADAVVLLSIEELAVNELRETFHRWVRTLALPVRDGGIGVPLAHVPARIRRGAPEVGGPGERERAGEIIEEVSAGLRAWLRGYRDELTQRLAPSFGSMARQHAGARTNATGSARARCRRSSSNRRWQGSPARSSSYGSGDARASSSTRPSASRISNGPSRRSRKSSRAAGTTTRRFETSCSASGPAFWTTSCPRASPWPVTRKPFR